MAEMSKSIAKEILTDKTFATAKKNLNLILKVKEEQKKKPDFLCWWFPKPAGWELLVARS